jgi:hypothetical protein
MNRSYMGKNRHRRYETPQKSQHRQQMKQSNAKVKYATTRVGCLNKAGKKKAGMEIGNAKGGGGAAEVTGQNPEAVRRMYTV